MPLLRTLMNTLEYSFVNIRGIVHIKFRIDVQISKNEIQNIKFYDILTSDHISLQSQYNFNNPNINFIDFYYDFNNQNKDYIKISVRRAEFLIKFKEYNIPLVDMNSKLLF